MSTFFSTYIGFSCLRSMVQWPIGQWHKEGMTASKTSSCAAPCATPFLQHFALSSLLLLSRCEAISHSSPVVRNGVGFRSSLLYSHRFGCLGALAVVSDDRQSRSRKFFRPLRDGAGACLLVGNLAKNAAPARARAERRRRRRRRSSASSIHSIHSILIDSMAYMYHGTMDIVPT